MTTLASRDVIYFILCDPFLSIICTYILLTHSCKMADFQGLVENLRTNFNSGITATKEYRTQQLKNLIRLLQEGENELAAALKDDLGKPSAEAVNFEIDLTKTATKTTLASFEK